MLSSEAIAGPDVQGAPGRVALGVKGLTSAPKRPMWPRESGRGVRKRLPLARVTGKGTEDSCPSAQPLMRWGRGRYREATGDKRSDTRPATEVTEVSGAGHRLWHLP